MIEFIYFDLGNVIVHFDHEIGCRKMADVAGCSVDAVRKAIFESDMQRDYETGKVDNETFYRHFCEQTNTEPDYEALYRACGDIFTLNVSIIPLIAALRRAGQPLGILSNTCAAHWDHCQRRYRVVRDVFDRSVLSFEVGSMKPDGLIYERAIDVAGAAAERIFFLDDRADNVAAARAAGLDAVQFHTAGQITAELRQRGCLG